MDRPTKSAADYLEAAEAEARRQKALAALEAFTPPPEPEPEPMPVLDPGPLPPVDPDVVIQWQGEWTWERAYTRGQLVSYRGSSYLALEDNQTRDPTETPGVWALVAQRGRKGDRGPAGQDGERGPRGWTGSPGASIKGDPGRDGAGGTFATPTIVLGTAAAEGVSADSIRSDATIVAFDATAPTTAAFGDSAATGSAAVAARRDHAHGLPANPVPAFGSPAASAVGDTASDGAATTLPRADHRHAREAFGTPGSSAVGDGAAAGSATTVAHSDHVHGREAFAAPAASAVGDAQATGTATTVPHSDHVHARESFGAASGLLLKSTAANGVGASPLRADASIKAFDTTAPVVQAFGDAAAVGTVDFAARRDHKHGMMADPVPAHNVAPNVHGLPASVNVLGNRNASGEFVQRGVATVIGTGTASGLTNFHVLAVTFPVAFSAVQAAMVTGSGSGFPTGINALTTTGFNAVLWDASAGAISQGISWVVFGT